MKKIIAKLYILLALLIMGSIFPHDSIAANCNMELYWADANNNKLSTISAYVSDTYRATAVFKNCVGGVPFFRYYGGSYGTTIGTPQGLGGKITTDPETRWANFTFNQEGDYYFKSGADFTDSTGQSSIHIIAVKRTTTPPPASTTKVFACKAGDGKYACASSAASITSSDGECADKTKNAKEVDVSWCGKTEAEVKNLGTVDNNITGIQNNSSNKLFNPLPEDDLTHAFLLVLQGLLSILGILAVVFVVVGGVQMVISGGNEEAITKAKKTITWAVLGLVAALLSFSMIAIVQELLQADLAPATTQSQTK